MPRSFTADSGLIPVMADSSPAEGVTIVTGISKYRAYLSTSRNLYMRKGLGFARDNFSHEIVLVVREGEKSFIFSSCSHSGLHNIMTTLKERGLLSEENIVFAGMHLFDPVGKRTESPAILERFADELAAFPNTTYYSGHCTGAEAFDFLKLRLGDRMKAFGCGEVFEF
jgi:7,8-dihydropterin-6-yl-methyl-4-(beta-D-ribofuranosyl)aminobenzene 5'-phosphate synthase